MATFVWDPAVRWPPPASILLNYDVVAPGDVAPSAQSSETTQGEEPMTKVVIVGEIYNAGLEVGGGPIYPGAGGPSHPWVPPSPGAPSHPWVPPSAGAPSHPIYIPGVGPAHPIVIPGVPDPQPGSPSHPIYIAGYPDQGLPGDGQTPGSPSHPWVPPGGSPSHPWVPPSGAPSRPWVPPEGETLPPPPEEIANSTVVAVWKPAEQAWTVTVYEPRPHPGG